jgi:glycosyltransferase involved in cell wall biosynthesis
VPEILERAPNAVVLLLGQHGHRLYQEIVRVHPPLAPRIHAPGELSSAALARHVMACDLLVQPYPDGISSRRTSAMAGLAFGVPLVTTAGPLTEAFWAETGCVSLVRVDDPRALACEALRLLGDDAARRRLSARGREIYDQWFDLRHTIGALRRLAPERSPEEAAGIRAKDRPQEVIHVQRP